MDADPETISTIFKLDTAEAIGITSSSPFSGSPTFDTVPLHVTGPTPPLGTYVVIRSAGSNFLHYGRIVTGQEENQRADPARLQGNRAYGMGERAPRQGDLSPHVVRVVAVQVLGEIVVVGGRVDIRDPQELPMTGQCVYALPAGVLPQVLNLPETDADGLVLGTFRSGGEVVTIRMPVEALARHTTIVGKPGVGKSHGSGVMVEECVRLKIPVVNFDVLGDLTGAADAFGGVTYRAGTPDFKIPYSIVGLSEFLAFIPNLTRDQQEIVALAYDHIYGRALRQLEDNGSIDIDLQKLLDEITDVGAAAGQGPVADRACRRVQAFFNRSSLLTTSTQDWLSRLRSAPMINIFVGHLPQHQRNLVVGATSRILQSLRRRNKVPPFVLLLDEAHLFLPSGGDQTPSTGVIRELVRTARHDGIGIVLVTQSPASMDRQVFLICNTRLVFALDPEDLRLVGGHLSDLPEEAINRIPRMRRGRCIFTSAMDIVRHSVEVDIRARNTPGGAPTPNLAKEAQQWRMSRPT
jgi:DNA helicase HerA-like ATPase